MESNRPDKPSIDEFQPIEREVSQEDIEGWLEKGVQVKDAEAALAYAQRVADIVPDDVRALEILHASIFAILDQDAFLGFISETADHYIVTLRGSRPVFVPKARAPHEIYPPAAYSEGERALGGIWWLLLGLVPAGIGAFFVSWLTFSRSVRVLSQESAPPTEKRMAWLALAFAVGVGMAAVVLMILLAMHFL